MTLTIPKTSRAARGVTMEARRDVKAWRSLRGIWKGKKLIDPVRWQRRIRL